MKSVSVPLLCCWFWAKCYRLPLLNHSCILILFCDESHIRNDMGDKIQKMNANNEPSTRKNTTKFYLFIYIFVVVAAAAAAAIASSYFVSTFGLFAWRFYASSMIDVLHAIVWIPLLYYILLLLLGCAIGYSELIHSALGFGVVDGGGVCVCLVWEKMKKKATKATTTSSRNFILYFLNNYALIPLFLYTCYPAIVLRSR